MKPARSLAVADHALPGIESDAPPKRRLAQKKRVRLGAVLVLDPWTNGKLRAAVLCGKRLHVTFDGLMLHLTTDRGEPDGHL